MGNKEDSSGSCPECHHSTASHSIGQVKAGKAPGHVFIQCSECTGFNGICIG